MSRRIRIPPKSDAAPAEPVPDPVPEPEGPPQYGVPLDVPVTIQVGEADPTLVGTVGISFTFGDPNPDTGDVTAVAGDPDDVGRQLAWVLERTAAELREQHGYGDPDEEQGDGDGPRSAPETGREGVREALPRG